MRKGHQLDLMHIACEDTEQPRGGRLPREPADAEWGHLKKIFGSFSLWTPPNNANNNQMTRVTGNQPRHSVRMLRSLSKLCPSLPLSFSTTVLHTRQSPPQCPPPNRTPTLPACNQSVLNTSSRSLPPLSFSLLYLHANHALSVGPSDIILLL